MLSIKPKTAFTNILEGGLPPSDIMTATQKLILLNLLLYFTRPYCLYETYDSFSNIVFLFSDEMTFDIVESSERNAQL